MLFVNKYTQKLKKQEFNRKKIKKNYISMPMPSPMYRSGCLLNTP